MMLNRDDERISPLTYGRGRLVGLFIPPFRPVGRALPLLLGMVFALTWSTPPRQPAAFHLEPGAASVLSQPRDVRFGLNQAWEAPDQSDMAGAGWSRLVFWWSAFQPRGPRDFNQFATDRDSYIDDELARGRELAGVVLNTPGWASAGGSPNAVPRNLYLSWDDPDNYWGQFMRRLAERYRGRIDAWIIWNEVDIRDGQWRTWDGTVDDYVQLERVAYRAIKGGNPDATVVLFGSPWWHDKGAYLTQVLDGLATAEGAAEWNHYFDVANLHMYSRANDIPEVIPWYRAQLAARGMGDKPIWIGETNVVPYDDPLWPEQKSGFRANMDEQASYVVEASATYLALGVQRIGVNRALDGQDFRAGGEPFGLIRNDLSVRPAYAAFQVICRYFSGVQSSRYFPTERSGLTRVVLERDGERVTVLWTMRPESMVAAVEATAGAALVVGKYGQASELQAEGGQYRIPLEPATANSNETDPEDYVVGGSPVILVERADGDLARAYRPLTIAPRPSPNPRVPANRAWAPLG
jgi:hypothetical protein